MDARGSVEVDGLHVGHLHFGFAHDCDFDHGCDCGLGLLWELGLGKRPGVGELDCVIGRVYDESVYVRDVGIGL